MVPRKSTYRGTHRYNTSTTTGCNGNYRSSQSQNNNYHHRYDLLLHLLRMIAQEPILMVLLCIWNVIAILGIVVLSQRLQNAANEFLGATNTITTMMNGSTTTTTTAANAVAVVVVPDVRYLGYTHEQLYTEFYNRIGTHGCSIYSTLALWDIVVLVPAYILLLGTFYVHVTRYTYDKVITTSTTSMSIWNTNNHNIHNDPYERGYWNADRRVSYLLLPIAILDWIETFIQRRGCTLLLLQQQLPQLQLSHLQVRIASMSVSMKWSMLLFFAITIMERLYRVVGTIQTSNKQHPSNHHRLLPLWM